MPAALALVNASYQPATEQAPAAGNPVPPVGPATTGGTSPTTYTEGQEWVCGWFNGVYITADDWGQL